MAKKLRCWLGMHPCMTSSDDVACWGECINCHKRFGYTERTYIRAYIEAEEAFRKQKESEK
jgi:hypothetical protein